MGEIINKAAQDKQGSEPPRLLLMLMVWFIYTAIMWFCLVPFLGDVPGQHLAGACILGWFSMLLADKK